MRKDDYIADIANKVFGSSFDGVQYHGSDMYSINISSATLEYDDLRVFENILKGFRIDSIDFQDCDILIMKD